LWFLSFWLSHWYPICFQLSHHFCYMPCSSHPHWLDHSNYTWRRVQVMKLIIMQFSPTSFTLSVFGTNILLSTLFWITLCPCSSLSDSYFHRRMYSRLLVRCHLRPIRPPVLPLNLTYISFATVTSEPALYQISCSFSLA
jgi:hypothetical protein